MANFPDIPPTSFSVTTEDNAIHDSLEYGYVQTRKKYTKARKIFKYEFKYIPESDAQTIMDFYNSVGTYDSFTLSLPKNQGDVIVRFIKPPTRQYVSPTTSNILNVEFREI